MSKYEPLKSFLRGAVTAEVPMAFADIERIISAPLPPVARKHRAWWSNNPSNSVITRAWLDAGFRTERVDMVKGTLVFRRADGLMSAGSAPPGRPSSIGFLDRIRATLGGMVTIPEGVDITAPTGEIWDAER